MKPRFPVCRICRNSARTLIAMLLLVSSMALLACSPSAPARGTIAFDGTSDLRGLADGSVVALDGQWAFYWNRFIDPATFLDGAPPLPDAYVAFPAVWSGYAVAGNAPVGYCTWQLSVTGLKPGTRYGIRASSFLSAARIYANGSRVQAHGVPGRTASEERPGWLSLTSPVEADARGRIDLVIHASNFSDRQGGTRTSMLFGDYGAIIAARESAVGLELFVAGAIAIMGAYYLGLFAFRRSDRASLWFGLFCLALAVRVLCYDEYFILAIVPGMPWRLLFDLGYLTFTLAVALFAAFIHATFPDEFPRWAAIAAAVAAGIYSAVVMVAPTRVSSLGLVWFQAVTVLVGTGAVAAIIVASVRRRAGAPLFGLGFLAMFGAVVHDILVSAGLLKGGFAMQLGMLGFLFALSLIMTRRFAGAFGIAERLSSDLARINSSLERFVPREFLAFLKKRTIEEIELGDSSAQDMAVMFVDVRAFSRIAESSTPQETFAFINEYLAHVGPAVRAHGGFIDTYLGDGFMALFPDGAEAAVRCALDVQRRVAEYNGERLQRGAGPMRVGIGIHAGQLMLGTIGESMRMDGTVISDAVNIASRLEGVSKEYGISIAASERILADLPDPTLYRMRFIGKIRVKGKLQPVSVFDIYDGDPDDRRSRKDLVRASFERGVEAYYARRFGDARSLFEQVLAALPDDGAALRYLGAIRQRSQAVR